MRPLIRFSFFKLVIFFVTISFVIYYFIFNSVKNENSVTIQPQITELVQSSTLAGNIEPLKKSLITAPFNGYVKKIFVRLGQKVKKGDPIISVTQSLQSTDPVFPLRSPFDGTIVQIQKNEGEFVKQDDIKDYILRIDDLTQLYIYSNVAELDYVKIKVGQSAIIKASAILDKKYKGKIEEISLASIEQDSWRNSSKVEYQTKVKIVDFDEKLKPGMSVILDIITNKKESVLTLPHEFVIKKDDKYYVENEFGKLIEIKIGLQNESLLEIVSGISEKDFVKQVDFVKLLLSEENK